jgi:hypothetical protein
MYQHIYARTPAGTFEFCLRRLSRKMRVYYSPYPGSKFHEVPSPMVKIMALADTPEQAMALLRAEGHALSV